MMRLENLLILMLSVFLPFNLFASEPAAIKLELATVNYEEVVVQRYFDATVEAVHKATIAAQVSERITEINFDVDDYVEQGSILIRFKDIKQRARLEQAHAGLREALVASKDAETELKRIRDIYVKKLVAKAVLDKANAVYKGSLARQTQAEARLKEAKEQFEQTIVRAPYSGIVTQRHVELGETPSIGKPLMTGLSLNRLRVVANVPQRFISVLRNGCCPAQIILPGEQQRVATKKLTIFPIADSQSHSFKIRADLEKGQYGLYPGMLVKLVLDVDTQKRLMIPLSALVYRGEVTGVYVFTKEKIIFRLVRSGRTHDGRVEIHAGLESDERIALDPIKAGILLKEQITQ
ncbi:MAG: efflux RND transporter periplasmic adaptor subunit [Sulfuriflexus sp.]|nr:efflux RND transporter periplasmic adaptor subunit [Sulfuriflexus sp.]